jgi:pimeloyl-ACP methyl ester carboxylesterase
MADAVSDRPARVVLVHGAWHGAWCWDRVVDGLSALGIEAVAVDLPGHGADPGPLGDLAGDAARVEAVLDGLEAPVVLVGHSYGGAVVTEAGVHPAVAHVVYVCAFAIDEGESCANAVVDAAASMNISHEGRPQLAEALVFHDDGTVTLTPELAAPCFYADCAPDDVAWALARLGPQRMDTMSQAPSAVAWRTKPSSYLVCTEDLAVHPDVQRLMAARCTTTVEWACSHSPFLSQPERLAELLGGIATGAS